MNDSGMSVNELKPTVSVPAVSRRLSWRWLVSFVALLATGALSIDGLASAFRSREREDLGQQRDKLRDWLAHADATAAPLGERQRMLGWLERDFRAGYDWQAALAAEPADARRRAAANSEVLSRMLFENVLDEYQHVRPSRRDDYLREQMARLRHWRALTVAGGGAGPNETMQMFMRFAQEVEARADRTQKKQLDEMRSRIGKLWLEMQIAPLLQGR